MDNRSQDEKKRPPQVGDKAPDFILPDSNCQDVHLSENRDVPIILVFFSETLSDYSIHQVAAFRSLHETLQNIGVLLFGIITEPIPTLLTFIEEEGIPFILLSDFDRLVSEEYGVLAESMDGLVYVAKPSVFVINKEGSIIYRWIGETHEVFPNLDDIAKTVLQSYTQ
jgi:peroxiredoxin Q/BCP